MDFTNVLTWGLAVARSSGTTSASSTSVFCILSRTRRSTKRFEITLSSSVLDAQHNPRDLCRFDHRRADGLEGPRPSKVAAVFSSKVTPVTNVQGWAAISYLISVFLTAWAHGGPSRCRFVDQAAGQLVPGSGGWCIAVILNVNVKNEQ